MRKLITFSTILLLAIGYLSWKYFSHINEGPISSSRIIKFIPRDATCVLTLNYDEAFNDLFSKYSPIEALLGANTTDDIAFLNTLFRRELETHTQNHDRKIFVSIHPNKEDNFNLLFSLSSKIEESYSFSMELLSKKGITTKILGDNIYELNHSKLHSPIYLSIKNQVLLASESKNILLKAASNQEEKITQQFTEAITENSQKNKNTPIIISFNHENIVAGIKSILRKKTEGNMTFFDRIQGESCLSMNYKNDALMFNGISTLNPGSHSYINLFSKQKPVESRLKNIIPNYTANYWLFSLSNVIDFQKNLNIYLKTNPQFQTISTEINKLPKVSGIAINRDIRPYLGNELVLIETSQKDKIAIIKLKNGEKTNFSLKLISEQYSEKIGKLNYSNIFYYLLGDPLKPYLRPFYSVIDNYLILSNTPSAIQTYLQAYNSEKFLIQTKEFQNHIQLVANKSNIEFFTCIENSKQVIKSSLKGKVASYFEEPYNTKNFYGLTWQWSANETHFQVNLYANYNAPQKEVLKEVWNYTLENRMNNIWGGFIRPNGKFLIVEDKNHTLYTLEENGKLIWKTKIDNTVKSIPRQLEDGSLIFNTSNYIHRLDSMGVEITGFPIKLKNTATGESCLLGYNSQSAKLYIPANNSIDCYPVNGTNTPPSSFTFKGNLLSNLLISSSSNTTFLMAATTNGTFYFLNPQGGKIRETPIKPSTHFVGNIYLARDLNNTPEIIASDTTGIVYRVNLHGNITTTTTINNWSRNQLFQWKNVTGDDKPEIIISDNKHLSILTEDGIPMYSYTFPKELKHSLSIQTVENNQSFIGISSNEEKKLYLFNDDGNLFKGFPVLGSGKFLVTKLLNDGNLYIILNKNTNKLYVYRL